MTEDRGKRNEEAALKNNSLHLPRLFSEGMVLQRSAKTRIWGWCGGNESVVVMLCDREEILASDSAEADDSGFWEVFLDLSKAGSGYVLEVKTGGGTCQKITDVAVGEVWLCSGQSNMELPIRRIRDRFPEEAADCEDDGLRIFKIMEHSEFREPLKDALSGEWKKSTAENVLDFSGLTWFYGRFLRRAQKVPVGLINVSLGGTPIEAWMGKEALKGEEDLLEMVRLYASEGFMEQKQRQDEEAARAWMCECREADRGLSEKWYQAEKTGQKTGQKDCGEEKTAWRKITLPGRLSERGLHEFKGVIWLKKRFHVPEEMAGKAAKLWLGTLTDSDETYINGTRVGETGYQYPPRKYEIPEGILQTGENEVTIRLTCNSGNGRMTPDKPCRIFTERQCVELAGEWEYRIGAVMERPAPEADFVSWKPTGVYNGMLAPCRGYTIKGFVWYQGESNDKAPQFYEKRLKRLISDWRRQWGQGDIPFLAAQLPGFEIDLPADSGWPVLREAQRRVMEMPHTAVTVNLDLGEWNDLHPLNKKDVAYRLSLAARALAYGEDVAWQGPVAQFCRVEGENLRIHFTETGAELLTVDGRPPEEFEAAGEDGRYYPVEARIEGNSVILINRSSREKFAERKSLWKKFPRELKKVRYAWRNCPDRGLLCNAAGLLASPFEMEVSDEDRSAF